MSIIEPQSVVSSQYRTITITRPGAYEVDVTFSPDALPLVRFTTLASIQEGAPVQIHLDDIEAMRAMIHGAGLRFGEAE